MNKDLEELIKNCSNYEELMTVCRSETRHRISEILKQFMEYYDTPEGRILLEEQLYSVLIQMLTLVQVGNRKLRKERQAEGIEAAMENGVQFGRKRKYNADDYIEIFKKLQKGEINKNTARSEIGACPNTFDRMFRQLKYEGKI